MLQITLIDSVHCDRATIQLRYTGKQAEAYITTC